MGFIINLMVLSAYYQTLMRIMRCPNVDIFVLLMFDPHPTSPPEQKN
jgi:hypothetical protein